LLGNEFEDRSGRAYTHALSTPGAARMVRISVPPDDDLRVLAPHSDFEDPHFLDILAGAHAPGAQDAGTHVVLDHDIARTLISTAKRQFMMSAYGNLVLDYVPLELIPRMGLGAIAVGARGWSSVAAVGMSPIGEMLAWVSLEQEVQHTLPIIDGCGRLDIDHHAVGRRSRTRRHKLVLSLNRNQADPAVANDGQLRVPAERGNINSHAACGLQDRLARLEWYGRAVQGQCGHEQPIRGRGQSFEFRRESDEVQGAWS
jgi:hypothetical protein